jgi:hypothetical protein
MSQSLPFLHLKTPEPQPGERDEVALPNAYQPRAVQINTRDRLLGDDCFGDRYKSVLVEGRDPWYYTTLWIHHLNPARAGLVKGAQGQSVSDFPWSSVASGYALPARTRAPWLAVSDGLAAFDYQDRPPIGASSWNAWIGELRERGAKIAA